MLKENFPPFDYLHRVYANLEFSSSEFGKACIYYLNAVNAILTFKTEVKVG